MGRKCEGNGREKRGGKEGVGSGVVRERVQIFFGKRQNFFGDETANALKMRSAVLKVDYEKVDCFCYLSIFGDGGACVFRNVVMVCLGGAE